MSFPSQGRRRSNSHWTYPRGRGTVSCVLHVLLQYYTIAIEFAHLTGHWSGMDKNCDGQFIARRPLRTEIQTAGETMGRSVLRAKNGQSMSRVILGTDPIDFALFFFKFVAAMSFSSQGRRPSTLHWTYPRCADLVQTMIWQHIHNFQPL